MKKKAKAILGSAIAIAISTTAVTGATMALFTDKAEVNVAMTAGRVDVDASVSSLKLYSMDQLMPGNEFMNLGRAYLSKPNELILDNITPGDKVEFDISVVNNSNIKTKYRAILAEVGKDNKLMQKLIVKINGKKVDLNDDGMIESDWELLDPVEVATQIKTISVSIELPVDANNDYMGKVANIRFAVESVQYNGITTTAVSYNANGGDGIMQPQEWASNVTDNLEMNAFTKRGYEFVGWNTASDGSGTSYVDGASFTMGDESVTLYAQWQIVNYNITYNVEGGNPIANGTYTVEDSVVLPTATKDGYEFAGWYDGENNPVQSIEAGSVGDKTLYATWTPVTYTITYDANGGVAVADGTFTIESATIVLGDTTKAGYTFDGWYNTNGEKVTEIASGSFGNVVLTAKWNANTNYVTFVANGGDGAMSDLALKTDEAGTLSINAFTREDYIFKGWALTADGGVEYADGAQIIMDADGITLYAVWELKASAALDFSGVADYDSATNSIVIEWNADQSAYANATFDIASIPLAPGFTATAYTDEDCTNEIATPNAIPLAEGNNVFYLKVEKEQAIMFSRMLRARAVSENVHVYKIEIYKPKTITLSTVVMGETNIVKYQKENTEITVPAVPTLSEGYNFEGWYIDEEFETEYVPAVQAESITLYAKTSLEAYTITYNENGGNEIADGSFTVEDHVTALAQPTREHYTFLGWFNANGNEVTEIAKGTTGNIELTAKWEAVEYTVTFKSEGEIVREGKVAYGSVITAPENPTKDATAQYTYTFKEWVGFTDGMTVGGDITFEAVFTATVNKYTVTFEGNSAITVEYGTLIKDIVANNDLTEPTKAATAQYTYTFAGWTGYDDATIVTGNATFNAEFIATVNEYTVVFKNGDEVVSSGVLKYGDVIVAPTTIPTKEATVQYTY
ncbi:MAG: InlB B-repeat-containing protein, partial [Clostridia bacterium]|nr:InlB B-repeat-containing protein [Clostridia bacterium]